MIEKFNAFIDVFIIYMIDQKEYLSLETCASQHTEDEMPRTKRYLGVLEEFSKLILLRHLQDILVTWKSP